MYDVVLVATDGSTPAERALDRALSLASEMGSELHVLSVVDTASLGLFSAATPEAIDDVLSDVAEAAVREAGDRAERAGVEQVTRTVRVGTPHREICAYADEVGAEVLVVGTHGRSGLSRAFLGSVASRVVRSSPVPVLVVPPR